MAGQKGMISVEKRIMLHLSNYRQLNAKFNAPRELTQDGIKNAVGTSRGYTSSLLNELINEGYIQENTGRIKGGKKIQKFFTITSAGKKNAEKIKRELSARQISIKSSDGILESVPFNDILLYLEKNEICADVKELDVLKVSTMNGLLDIEKLQRFKKRQFVDLSSEAPEIMHFYGRKEEMMLLEKWLMEDEKHNIVVIHGMAGIGKTTLTAKLCEEHRGAKHLFWYNFRNLDTLKGLLLDVSEFLCKIGYDHLELYLRTHRGIDFPEVVKILKKSMGTIEAIFVFDDFQKSNDTVRDFFGYFTRMLGSPSKTKMLILSREIVPFYDRKDVVTRKIVGELKLDGLDYKSSKEMLKEKGIQTKKHRDIFEITGGNPLFLELFESKYQIDRYMHDELFSNLDREERNTLGALSIYRLAVPEEALFLHEDFDFERLFDLFHKSIVKKDAYDKYFIHDLIKQFYYSKLSSGKRKKYHLIASRWYGKREEYIDFIETIYHYIEAREFDRASRFAIANSTSILDNGHANELLAVLDKMEERDIETNIWGELLVTKGKSCYMIGEWEKALSFFTRSTDIATLIGNNELKVLAFNELGLILEEQNELERALEYFTKCYEISEKTKYDLGIALGSRGLGRIYWRKSEPKKALTNLSKAIEMFANLGNNDLLAITLVDMGNILDERYETANALETYNKALSILDPVNNKREIIRVYLNIAVTYRHMKKYEGAIEYYTKTLTFAKELNEIKWIGYANAGLSYCYVKINDLKMARLFVKKADTIAMKIDNENIMYDVYKTYAFICKNEKKWDEAIDNFRKSIGIVQNLDALYYLSDSHYEFGLLFKERGDMINAKKHFNIASKLYRKMGVDRTFKSNNINGND